MIRENVLATLSYVKKFAGKTVLIKLGGAALQDSDLVKSICEDLSLIRSVGVSVILVHGGGPSINEELTRRGITWSFSGGLRVTSPEMMEVIEMVLCGGINRRIVRTLNHAGVRAAGLSGADARMLLCKPASADLGQVGEIENVDTAFLNSILNAQTEKGEGTIPVIAPVGVGRHGEAFNVNADWAAARIAESMDIAKVLFLTDQDGILNENQKLIPELDAAELEQLIVKEVVTGGMLAKVRTILHALRNGVKDVHILNARRPHGLIEELFTEGGVGTVCRLRTPTGHTTGEASHA